MDLERIAVRVAGIRAASEYEAMLDDYLDRLTDADKFLNVILDKTPAPEGKAIVMGIHQDLFQTVADTRGWLDRLKSMARSKRPGAAPAPE